MHFIFEILPFLSCCSHYPKYPNKLILRLIFLPASLAQPLLSDTHTTRKSIVSWQSTEVDYVIFGHDMAKSVARSDACWTTEDDIR